MIISVTAAKQPVVRHLFILQITLRQTPKDANRFEVKFA